MIKLSNIDIALDYDNNTLYNVAAEKLNISVEEIGSLAIAKRKTIRDDKENVHFRVDLNVCLKIDEKNITFRKNISIAEDYRYNVPHKKLDFRPIVVGSGPAGMFSALILAESGCKPIILERGFDVDTRAKAVDSFWRGGKLNPECNVQFGEGGAGAFSDGKLKPGKLDARKYKILSEFVKSGAPEEILYLEKPHIGTDNLINSVKNIRNKIISLGGEFIFGAKFTDILTKNGNLTDVRYVKDGEIFEIASSSVVLAIGHSSRDTLKKLYSLGIPMEQHCFGVGVRIEHPQALINKLMYGKFANHKVLGAADYRLVSHLPNGRNVYTFCNCPGGQVVAAASEENAIVTNGMSLFKRDGQNANSAMLVTILKEDFQSNHPLAGIELQQKIERAAFNISKDYKAPCQRLEDFMRGSCTVKLGEVLPTYRPGTVFAKAEDYLPMYITEAIKEAMSDMDNYMKGYYFPDAVMTGPETRSTSPVRILRGENLQSPAIVGLYPCGEGAGYAGGIVSAALDGIMCAEKILS